MDLRDAEYIVRVAETRSITQAAAQLGITQPSLSKFVSQLERRLRVRLFERQGKSLLLTNAGEEYVKTSFAMLDLKRQLNQKLEDISLNREGGLRIGITPARARYVLPKILPAFRKQYPNYTVEVLEDNMEKLEKALAGGAIHLAFFTVQPLDKPEYMVELVCPEHIALCMNKDLERTMKAERKRGFRYPWIDVKQLQHELFLVLNEQTRLGKLVRKLFREMGISPRISELSNVETAISLAVQGYGVCLCSEISFIDQKKDPNIRLFSTGNAPLTWDFVIARRSNGYCSKTMQDMIRLCKDIYRDRR